MSAFTSNYRVTVDSKVEDAIVVHLGSNKSIKFTWCGNGLYYFDTADIGHMKTPQDNINDDDKTDKSKIPVTVYSFLSKAVTNKYCFSQREIEGADNVRLLQGRILWPENQDYKIYLIFN